jgi:hypothetical protein
MVASTNENTPIARTKEPVTSWKVSSLRCLTCLGECVSAMPDGAKIDRRIFLEKTAKWIMLLAYRSLSAFVTRKRRNISEMWVFREWK